jgi:hypothetical protein
MLLLAGALGGSIVSKDGCAVLDADDLLTGHCRQAGAANEVGALGRGAKTSAKLEG